MDKIPNVVQNYMMSFVEDKDLLNLRLVDKKANKNATAILNDRLENHKNTEMQKKIANKLFNKKIADNVKKDGGYSLIGIKANGEFSQGALGFHEEHVDLLTKLEKDETVTFFLCKGSGYNYFTNMNLTLELYKCAENDTVASFDPKVVVPGDYQVVKFSLSKKDLVMPLKSKKDGIFSIISSLFNFNIFKGKNI